MERVVVACSGGPDSMALLDWCQRQGLDVVVAHVDYQKRDTAARDREIVQTYCRKKGIPFYVHKPVYVKGNFQDWARTVRYDFFEQVAEEVGAETIYVAHQMDDVIETYLFQKENGRLADTYGIASVQRHGLQISRPFLTKEKKELEAYCQQNHIPYGIDETNLQDHYTRNRIRHQKVETLTRREKEAMLREIERENERLCACRNQASAFWEKDGSFSGLSQEKEAWFFLEWKIRETTGHHISRKQSVSLLEQLAHGACVCVNGFWFQVVQDRLVFKKAVSISPVRLEQIEYKNYGHFSLRPAGKTIESVDIQESDWPVVIRPVHPGDKIRLRYGTKKVSRFLIDRKIPEIERKGWLVIENKDQTVIFVPGIGCDINHYSEKANVFMIQ